MKKRFYIFIILMVVVSCLSFIATFFMVLLINDSCVSSYEKNIDKKIESSLSKYNHNQMVFFNNNILCFNNKLFYFDDNIEVQYIDDEMIFLYDYSHDEYKLNYINGVEMVKKTNRKDAFYPGMGFYYNLNAYYQFSKDSYYKYSFETEKIDYISQNEYNSMLNESRFGKEYNIIYKNKNFEIVNKVSNNTQNLSFDELTKNDELSSIYNIKHFTVEYYKVCNNNLYINLRYKSYNIVVYYDMQNGLIDLYDWCKSERYNTTKFVNFSILSAGQSPSIINKYFIL